jgi:hypothetical protein
MKQPAPCMHAPAGLGSVYQQRAPESGQLLQTSGSGEELYTTYYSEAELLEPSAGLEGATYRVAIATAGFHARRAALAATLVTWRQQDDSVHFINPYYGSMLARNTSNYDAADQGNQQYNFLPYAIVRTLATLPTHLRAGASTPFALREAPHLVSVLAAELRVAPVQLPRCLCGCSTPLRACAASHTQMAWYHLDRTPWYHGSSQVSAMYHGLGPSMA